MTRVRFAPSPTGYLHIGAARSALFNWLFARKVGGKFLLRIEATEQERSYSEIEDLVLLRSDGHPLYNLSVVLDDIEMNITHVIRGQDHLTNTHKQILLYHAFGAPVPQFAHLPLILAPNKAKLSKRKHGEVVSLTTYRDRGFIPDAFVNFLVRLGWAPASPPDSAQIIGESDKG